ncbi:MAG: hypothetical protein OXH73_04050 [Caldilineaceae bacterium]|nr:hypothetical protein [Caldilineaceae bacterium]
MNDMTTEERVSKLEGSYKHLATKADVANASMSVIKWIVGVGATLLAAQVAMWVFILSRLP